MTSEEKFSRSTLTKRSEGRTPSANAVGVLAAQMFRIKKGQRLNFSAWSHGHALPMLSTGAAPRNCVKASPAFLFSYIYIYGT